jgi:diguanylate cyclase
MPGRRYWKQQVFWASMSVDFSSTRGLTASRVLHSRLARRIALSVLLAVVLPLGLLALLGGQVLESLADRFSARERLVLVRTVAQQVAAHLGNDRTLMAAWPTESPVLESGADPRDAGVRNRLPGLGMQFKEAALVGRDGQLRWSTSGWPGPLAGAVTALPAPARTARSQLLAHERNGQLQLVLAQPPRPDGTRWLAELATEALWQPVTAAEGSEEANYWCVQNAQGLRLYCPPPAADNAGRGGRGRLLGVAIADRVHTGWTLPLDADYGDGDWQFDLVQVRVAPTVLEPALTGPLVGGALCALSGVLLASSVLIRRTLGPLQRLQQGARQLEQRAPGVRVDVGGRDEFRDLAQAFNEMAGAVDAQFQSLELLASIDRDIVGHRAVDEVFRRVLVQGLPGLGAAVMGLARIESARVPRLHLQWNDEAFAHKVRRSVRALSPAEVEALLGVTVDTVWQPSGPSLASAWCAPMRQDKDAPLQALPLRWQGRTHGLLLLGWTTEPALQRLREAAELRDRLSVALASHQRELELTWQARHDDLTGLLNRNGLHQELDALLAADPAAGPGAPATATLAVLFIDLDHFKTVNDNLGHSLGDELLRQAAERLEACAPTRAVVARPGGDEFVLVLPGASDTAAIEVASAVCRRMAVPFTLSGKEHFLGASIGIALAPVHGNSRIDLLRHADMAMYTAKDAGRGRHAMFEEPLDARLLERSALLADLRQAVARKELVLHFQPRVCVADGSIVSAEALVRWRHPVRGLVQPGVFIPLAEESELIEVIGLWVIRAACAQLARWRREGMPLQRLSVNVSPRQLQSGRLLEEVEAALVQHGVPWNMLELEVTESLLVGDARSASEQLSRLRERGVLIALDDFGTGYSSMATLRNLPIDVMKVDRAFVQDLSDDPSALAVTRAILTLAQALGKHTVAEGIETQAQADTLRQLGCDEFQGFLFSKPVPAKEFAALCRFSAQQNPVASLAAPA